MTIQTILKNKNVAKIGKETVVILPLKKWKQLEEIIEELEDATKFNEALSDFKNQKLYSFDAVKKFLKFP